jgi:hypothetical protein
MKNLNETLKQSAILAGKKHGLTESQSVFELDGMTYGFFEMKGKKHARFRPLYGRSEKIDCLIHTALWNGIKIK